MTDDASAGDDYEDGPEVLEAPGLAVTALAGATGSVVGLAVGGPAGAVVGGASTPYLALFMQKAVSAIRADKSRRAEKMLQAAAETVGLSKEEFTERASATEETRFLTGKAVQAATDTIWPEGVRAIGRALAAGVLAKDKAALDIRQRVLGIMKDLDELHVRLLELLVRYEPDVDVQRREYVAIPPRIPSYVDKYLGGERPDNPKIWTYGTRRWTTQAISGVAPDLQPVLGSLLGELRESGLARENDTAPEVAKRHIEDLAKQVNRQAGQMDNGRRMKPVTLQPTTIQGPEPTWSPTELGEQILGFYAEAGAEDSQDQD